MQFRRQIKCLRCATHNRLLHEIVATKPAACGRLGDCAYVSPSASEPRKHTKDKAVSPALLGEGKRFVAAERARGKNYAKNHVVRANYENQEADALSTA